MASLRAALLAMPHVRQDSRWLEVDHVVAHTHGQGVELLDEVGHVVRNAQEVLFVGAFPGFTGDGDAADAVAVAFAALAFDAQDVVAGDTVVEDDAAVDLEVVGRFGQVAGCHVGIAARRNAERGNHDGGEGGKTFAHGDSPG